MCLRRLKQHVTNDKKKHEKPIENVEIVHFWHHMYSILSTFLFIPACYFYDLSEREKEGDLTQSYDKTPYTNRKFENQRTTHTNATKNFDYTTIADRLRTVSWSNK